MDEQKTNQEVKFPPVEECVKIIADALCIKVTVAAAVLMAQAKELNMSIEEWVHIQYLAVLRNEGGKR